MWDRCDYWQTDMWNKIEGLKTDPHMKRWHIKAIQKCNIFNDIAGTIVLFIWGKQSSWHTTQTT